MNLIRRSVNISQHLSNLTAKNAGNAFNLYVRAAASYHTCGLSYQHTVLKSDEAQRILKTGLGNHRISPISAKWINQQTAFVQRCYSTKSSDEKKSSTEAKKSEAEPILDGDTIESNKKLGLFARFKKMSKEYWFVLLPVHIVTSCFWFGGFYYLSTRWVRCRRSFNLCLLISVCAFFSGVDIVSLLQSLNFSESVISKLRDSSMGHLAIAYMCYKIATPARYTVTLGGTTLSIKYLSRWGYIKPLPTKEQWKQIYQDQKSKFKRKD